MFNDAAEADRGELIDGVQVFKEIKGRRCRNGLLSRGSWVRVPDGSLFVVAPRPERCFATLFPRQRFVSKGSALGGCYDAIFVVPQGLRRILPCASRRTAS